MEVSNVGTIEGTWVQGVLQGKAVVTYAGGERFEGMYANNRRNGPGVDFRLDGSKEECRWIEDVRQSPCTASRRTASASSSKTATWPELIGRSTSLRYQEFCACQR